MANISDFAQERIPSTIILQPEETMKCFVSDAINDDEIALEPTEFFTLTINDVTPNDDTRINLGPPTIIIINDNDGKLMMSMVMLITTEMASICNYNNYCKKDQRHQQSRVHYTYRITGNFQGWGGGGGGIS